MRGALVRGGGHGPVVGTTGRRHRGRKLQPTNHSKLTDSNNCVFFLILTNNYSCSFLDSSPPCALCRSLPAIKLSLFADMLITSQIIAQAP